MSTVLLKKSLKKSEDVPRIYEVGPNSDFFNIQEAIDKAKKCGGTIYISPGEYKENLKLYPGITLEGRGIADFRAISLIGTHTIIEPGNYSFNHLLFESDGSIFSVRKNDLNPALLFRGCGFDVEDGYVLDVPKSSGSTVFFDCVSSGVNNGFIDNTYGTFNSTLFNMTFSGGKGRNTTKFFGRTLLYNVHAINQINIEGNDTSTDIIGGSWIEGSIKVLGGASLNIECSSLSGGNQCAIYKDFDSYLRVSNCSIESEAEFIIEGEGAIFLSGNAFIKF